MHTDTGIKISSRSTKIAIAAILITCFLPLGESLHSGFWSAISDGIHVPLFFVLVLLANFAIRHDLPKLKLRLAVLFGTALFAAVAIEIIQPYFSRSESFVDIQNGMIGTCLALIFIVIRESNSRRGIHPAAAAGYAAALIVGNWFAFYPASEYWRLERLQEKSFPELSGFGDKLELLAWEPYGGATAVYNDGIEVGLGGKNFSGAELAPARISWRRFGRLKVKIVPPPEGISLWIRIDDDGICEEFNDRYAKEFRFEPGEDQIEIPLSEIENQPAKRRLNLDSIKRVLVYAAPETTAANRSVKITIRSISLAQ